MTYYVDTSAVMKLVAQEAESAAFDAWVSSIESEIVSSELLRVELLRSVRRRDPAMLMRAQEIVALTPLLGITTSILEFAGILNPVGLRSLDAIHLASALSLGGEIEGFVTYDVRLIEAARAMGLVPVTPV